MTTSVPVAVLTGFLGSGKTTLLNRLLKDPALAGTAVVVNEFGEIGLDHLILEPLDGETVVMAAGCLCCTIREDLAATLVSLKHRRDTGVVPPFERIIIETTGLADPAPIAQLLLTHPDVVEDFRLTRLIALLDGVLGAAQLDDTPECAKQVAMADAVILSKTDMAGGSEEVLKGRVARLNPGVPIHAADAVDAALFTAPDRPETLNLDALRLVPEDGDGPGIGHEHEHDHHDVNRHDAGIRAVPLVIDEPQDWMSLSMWLSYVISTHGANLLRLKGVVHVTGEPGPVVINGVRHVFHEPAHLPAWPDADRRTRLVFILKDLEPEIILDSWRDFAAAG
jgi:G3E family GTPase